MSLAKEQNKGAKDKLPTTPAARTLGLLIAVSIALAGCEQQMTKENIGTGIGAVAGGYLGSKVGSNDARVLATILGTAAGAWLGGRIGAYLDERDRQTMARATYDSAVSGKSQQWTNPDSGVSGNTRVVNSHSSQKQIAVPVLKDRVKQVPPLDLIGEPYAATKGMNVRGGPGTDFVVVGSLNSGEVVDVIGKVQSSNWYMIGEGGAASGFVYAPLLKPSATAAPQKAAPAGEIATEAVMASQTCRTIEQTVVLADGSQHKEQVTACQGPDGWQII